MEWSRQDELILTAAYCDRTGGDLTIDYPELARKCGLTAASARPPWPTIKRRLKEGQDQDVIVLSSREHRQLATLYQSSIIDELKFDFNSMARELQLDKRADAESIHRGAFLADLGCRSLDSAFTFYFIIQILSYKLMRQSMCGSLTHPDYREHS